MRFLENGYLDEFSEEEIAFFNAVVAVADSRYGDAIPILGTLLDEKPVLYLTEATLHATYLAHRFGGAEAAGAELFERLAERENSRSSGDEYAPFISLKTTPLKVNSASGFSIS